MQAVSHSLALVDMFDLTLWLVAGLVLPRGDAWRSRTTHQDRHVARHMVSLHLGQDTLVKTWFCDSILSAPLLTDPRRLTVGPGTREDIVTSPFCDRSAVLVVEYIAVQLCLLGVHRVRWSE